jgi:tripartite-type tricarboxylate transporter receptor subunit TctC
MRPRLRSITSLMHLLPGCAGTRAASAQDYPVKPVRIIEPFGVGGGPDLLARALASKLSELWGQSVTVENHPGAGATAGPALVAKSPAEGHTLLINTSAQAYSATLSKAEAGVAGFDFPIWYGIWAPAGSPTGVVDKLTKDVARALAGQDLRDWVAKHGGEPMSMTQPVFARFVQSESERAAQLSKAAGIEP